MSYRDDLEAAKLRRNALANELKDVRRRIDQLTPLQRQAQALERELTQSGRELNRARVNVTLPLLQQVRVASPCQESWDHMTGDDRVRHCQRCDKNVYDLSSMDGNEAENLLQQYGESLCVRFYRRRDGTVMSSDCAVGRGKRRRRNRTLAAAFAASVIATGGASTAFFGQPTTGQVMMGKASIMPAEFSEAAAGELEDSELYEVTTGAFEFDTDFTIELDSDITIDAPSNIDCE